MAKISAITYDWGFWFYWSMATAVGWVLGRFLFPNLAFIVIGLAMGIMQWFVLQHRFPRAWRWILLTTLGWTLGSALILPFRAEGLEFLVGLILGVTTGFCQWLFLRQEIYLAGWWIVIMVIGWTSGLAFLPGLILTGIVVGMITGFGLELLLRNPKPRCLKDEPEKIDR